MQRKNHGFTLLELSIVLLVMALIIGGIAGSKVMVRNSELRSVVNEMQGYANSIRVFKDKYGFLPGDFNTATTLWPAATGCPVPTFTTTQGVVAPIPTCNGNGNGTIGADYESVLVWNHLANAGFVPGHYTGISSSASSNYDHMTGINAPASALNGGGWSFRDYTDADQAALTWIYKNTIGHTLNFGAKTVATSDIMAEPILRAQEAYDLDTKLDDGKPGLGIVVSRVNVAAWLGWPNCATGGSKASPAGASYNLSYTGTAACGLIFLLDGPMRN